MTNLFDLLKNEKSSGFQKVPRSSLIVRFSNSTVFNDWPCHEITKLASLENENKQIWNNCLWRTESDLSSYLGLTN